MQAIKDRPKRKRKEAILLSYANGTITDYDYRQFIADGQVELALQMLTT